MTENAPGTGSDGAGRVIAGSARGIRLVSPGEGTRPLSDRVKQTLFAILEPRLAGARFLDLFAGSGAAGIEALSRRAVSATFVERDAGAIRTLAANLDRTHLAGPAAAVVRADAIPWLADPMSRPSGPYDIVLIDPPYDRPELMLAALERLGAGGVLAPGATIVAKHFWRTPRPPRVGLLASGRERRFGDTTLTFYGAAAEEAPRPDEEDG